MVSPSSGRNTAGSYKVNKTLTYTLQKSNVKPRSSGALIDCGANVGLAGADCRIIAMNPDSFVNIEGIDRHQVTNIPVVTCGAYTVTKNHGPVILIFHQFAGIQKGPGQLEAFHNKVNERSLQFDPKGQLITTNDGFELPLNVRNGLAYLDMRPYTDSEWDSLLHVVMTSDVDWDPSILDGEFPIATSDNIHDAMSYNNGMNFNVFGNYKLGTIVASAHVLRNHLVITTVVLPEDLAVENGAPDTIDHESIAYTDPQIHQLPPKPPPVVTQGIDSIDTCQKEFSNLITPSPHISASKLDPSSLRKSFAFLPTEVVSRTLSQTTQCARVPNTDTFRRFYQTPFPALNVARPRSEDLLTDIIYSDNPPAVDDGSTSAAIYSGRLSHVLDVFGMKTDAQFVNTLEDIIRERGAPTRLLSDSAIVIRSSRVKDILRALYIGQCGRASPTDKTRTLWSAVIKPPNG
jgi:hypothetical protein